MTFNDAIHRICAWLKHRLTATNTLGHGIHSPKLYYIVESLFYDDNAYYAFAHIEKQRQRLLRARKTIYVNDFGTGASGERKVADIAAASLKPAKQAQLLFRLVNYLNPQNIVELGTSLGITTAYLAMAAPKAKVITMEGSDTVADEAKKVFGNLKINNIQQVVGNIDDNLSEVIKQLSENDISFFFVDANHTESATKCYFDKLKTVCSEDSIMVFDDIHASAQMEHAWSYIKEDKAVTSTIDAFSMGFVFFDKHLLKKHYKLRI